LAPADPNAGRGFLLHEQRTRLALARVIDKQLPRDKVGCGAAIMGDFIIPFAAFVVVLVPLLAFMRQRRRGR
jgi:hypothetical protein